MPTVCAVFLSLSSKSNELTALVVGVPTNYTKGDIPLIVLRGPRERDQPTSSFTTKKKIRPEGGILFDKDH